MKGNMNDDLVKEILRVTANFTDEERLIFWHQIQSGYCRECGRHKGTEICHCRNDE